MIERTTSANIESVLSQIRKYQAQMGVNADAANPANASSAREVDKPGFGQAVKDAIGSVNETQVNARAMAEAYERGSEVPLAEVVLGMQKASIAFEATLQVRNKVLKAYEDIMNMPV